MWNALKGLVLANLLIAGIAVNAQTIIDTGPGPSISSGPWLNSTQYLAGEFTIESGYTIEQIDGWMWPGGRGTVAIYDDGGDVPGIELFSAPFAMCGQLTPDWCTSANPSWKLRPGTYWVSFEARSGDTLNSFMPGPPSSPLQRYAFFQQGTGWRPTSDQFGVRIIATPIADRIPRYEVINLGHLGGGDSVPNAINDNGQVVGSSKTATGARHAFIYSDGDMLDIGTLGGLTSNATAINSRGQVVGSADTFSGQLHAFLFEGGAMIDLGTLGGTQSVATGINDLGQIVGWAYTAEGVEHAFLYENGSITDLGTLGGSRSSAFAINNSGQIVGRANTIKNYYHAFLFEDGRMIDLGTLGGYDSAANAINSSGELAGYSKMPTGNSAWRHAFLYSGSSMQDLGVGGYRSEALGINDRGQVVGFREGYGAFVFGNGTTNFLNELVDPYLNYGIGNARDINNHGWIVAATGGGGAMLVPVDSDALPPTINLIAGDGCVNEIEATQQLIVAGTAESDATVIVALGEDRVLASADSNGVWMAIFPEVAGLADGQWRVSAFQVDVSSNVSTTNSRTFMKDTAVPSGSTVPDLDRWWDSGVSDSDNLTKLSRLRFRGTTAEPGVTVFLSIDWLNSGTARAGDVGAWMINTTTLRPGPHEARVQTADACGNRGPVSAALDFVIDTSAPSISVSAVAGDNRINAQETGAGITVGGSAEAGATVALSVVASNRTLAKATSSSGTWTVTLSSAELASLADGTVKLKAKATDAAGNSRTVTRTVTKDTVIGVPVINAIAGDDVISAEELGVTLYVTGTAEARSAVTFTLANVTRKVTASSGGTWSVSLTSTTLKSLPTGSLQARAVAVDKAGNVSPTGTRTVVKQ